MTQKTRLYLRNKSNMNSTKITSGTLDLQVIAAKDLELENTAVRCVICVQFESSTFHEQSDPLSRV